MGLGNDSGGGSGGGKNPLHYPIARNRFATMWVGEGDDGFYFSVKLELPFIGEENFSLSGTDRSVEFVNQVGQSWKEQAAEAGE